MSRGIDKAVLDKKVRGGWMTLPAWGGLPETQHQLEEGALLAINAALATGRPLLVRGEPGTGKSQLARAAAHLLDAALLVRVVDARTEIEDLFWRLDAVRRLADAHLPHEERRELNKNRSDIPALDERRYIIPEALWWTFDWNGAANQAELSSSPAPPRPEGWNPERGGRVLLLDEIDKADESLPNGLLGALGSGCFGLRGQGEVRWTWEHPPLIIVTTNEERPLPDAFLRRCLVLHIALPTERQALVQCLMDRGARHVPQATEAVLLAAAEILADDRATIDGKGFNPPGQAEYIDLLHAVCDLFDGEQERLEQLKQLREFALWKHEAMPEDLRPGKERER